MLEAIDWRGIHAAGVYEFAQHFGESVPDTANPSTADAVPLPLTREAWLRILQVQLLMGGFAMCRKNQINAAALLGFGAGLLVGLLIESQLLGLLVGSAAICGGFGLLRGRC